jgi:hypothetical protein
MIDTYATIIDPTFEPRTPYLIFYTFEKILYKTDLEEVLYCLKPPLPEIQFLEAKYKPSWFTDPNLIPTNDDFRQIYHEWGIIHDPEQWQPHIDTCEACRNFDEIQSHSTIHYQRIW